MVVRKCHNKHNVICLGRRTRTFSITKRNTKLVYQEQHMEIDRVVGRSLMKRLISLSGLGLVKGGAVSGAKIWRVLRNNDEEISLHNKRPKVSGGKGMSEFT